MQQTAAEASKKFKQQTIENTRSQYGDAAADFMEFVYSQNVQMEILGSMLEAAAELNVPDNREMAEKALQQYTKIYAVVQSRLTESFAKSSQLTEEIAKSIFDTANDAYETISETVKKPEQTND